MKKKRERHANSASESNRCDRDKKAITERLAAGGCRDKTDVRSQRELPIGKEAANECECVGVEDADNQDKEDEKGDHGLGTKWKRSSGIVTRTLSPGRRAGPPWWKSRAVMEVPLASNVY